MKRTEEAIQAALIVRCQLAIREYPALRFLFHVPNGGARNPLVGAQMKALGVKRGVPDLWLPVVKWGANSMTDRRNGIVLEMKAPGVGRLSDEQREWMDYLTQQGWLCYVRDNEQEAFDTLVHYLEGHPDEDAHAIGSGTKKRAVRD